MISWTKPAKQDRNEHHECCNPHLTQWISRPRLSNADRFIFLLCDKSQKWRETEVDSNKTCGRPNVGGGLSRAEDLHVDDRYVYSHTETDVGPFLILRTGTAAKIDCVPFISTQKQHRPVVINKIMTPTLEQSFVYPISLPLEYSRKHPRWFSESPPC